MTNDEKARIERTERNMEFIVAQQAQFAADMQQVREVLHTHSEALVSVTGMVGKIAEAHTALVNRMTELEGKMSELAGAQRGTEDRINAFITFVEKYISSHNGGGH